MASPEIVTQLAWVKLFRPIHTLGLAHLVLACGPERLPPVGRVAAPEEGPAAVAGHGPVVEALVLGDLLTTDVAALESGSAGAGGGGTDDHGCVLLHVDGDDRRRLLVA